MADEHWPTSCTGTSTRARTRIITRRQWNPEAHSQALKTWIWNQNKTELEKQLEPELGKDLRPELDAETEVEVEPVRRPVANNGCFVFYSETCISDKVVSLNCNNQRKNTHKH